MKYDVIIVGAGAAGLSAALYTSRRNLKTLVISEDIGGQGAMAGTIENYPGLEETTGPKLMTEFYSQAQKFGAEIKTEEVLSIQKKEDKFLVKTNTKESTASAVILAFGLSHRHLNVLGEEKFIGKGVAYCATCDAPLYKGKTAAVVGGGNSALDAALLLAKNSPKVYLIYRGDKLSGEDILIKQILSQPNIEVLFKTQITEIKGEASVNKIVISQNNQEKELETAGVFVEIGYEVKSDFIKGLVSQDEKKQIIIDLDGKTSEEGIFAAGDVTNISFKQVIISAGEGAKAALSCHKYLQSQGLTKGVFIDWGKKK
ncbi:MAG: FAD-dependent oxidoreductase [Patescibacteria group bacterium]